MPKLRASHILVPSQKEAEDLRRQIVDEAASFAELARLNSQCPSGEQGGGDLGWFEKGMMVKPFEDACMALQIDEVSQPVKTQFGYHLVKLTGKK